MAKDQVSPKLRMAIFWAPRVLTICFILFLAFFALDVFGQGYSWAELAVALFMHLIPNFILIAILVACWRRPCVCAGIFASLGLWYTIAVAVKGYPFWAVPIAGPAFVIAALFWLDGRLSKTIIRTE